MNFNDSWLELQFLGNDVRLWLTATGMFVAAMMFVGLAKRLLERRLKRAEETSTGLDDVILHAVRKTKLYLLAFPLLNATFGTLTLHPKAASILGMLAVIGFMSQAGLWAGTIAEFWLRRYRQERGASDPAALTTLSALSFVLKIAVWVVVAVLALDNLGFDVTALVTGLGIGGIAIALATQNILGDLFASLSIIVDKPFVIGDYIVIDNQGGKVEKIGLKTTRVRALTGEMLVYSNGDLLQSRIRNFRPMIERRATLRIGVVYQTPREVLEKIPVMLKRIIEAQEGVRFDRAHFIGFGDSSLDFEAIYYVLSPEYNVFADVQQAVDLEVVSKFAAEGIDFAFPSRTLYMAPSGENESDRAASLET